MSALDISDIRVREGLRISLDAIGHMQKIADQEGIALLVLLIPTKELVYSKAVSGLDDYPVPEVFHNLIKTEMDVRGQVKADLDRKGIAWLDALPGLQQALDRGERIYSPNSNGHPEAGGYRVIAATVADWVKTRQSEH